MSDADRRCVHSLVKVAHLGQPSARRLSKHCRVGVSRVGFSPGSQKGRPSRIGPLPASNLVAGGGFEPPTFGL